MPGDRADAQPSNGFPREKHHCPVPSPHAGTSGATGRSGKASNPQTAPGASAGQPRRSSHRGLAQMLSLLFRVPARPQGQEDGRLA